MKKILIIGLVFIAAGTALAFEARRFRASLAGSQEVPAVITDASGISKIRINDKDQTIDFSVRVKDAKAVTQAHLHCAPVGQNGPIVAFLFGNVPGGFNVNGELANFTLTAANLTETATQCAPAITNFASLAQAIRAGSIYVNVHTAAHPTGELRGQLAE